MIGLICTWLTEMGRGSRRERKRERERERERERKGGREGKREQDELAQEKREAYEAPSVAKLF